MRKLVAFSWWLASICVLQVSQNLSFRVFSFLYCPIQVFLHMNWLTFLHFDLGYFFPQFYWRHRSCKPLHACLDTEWLVLLLDFLHSELDLCPNFNKIMANGAVWKTMKIHDCLQGSTGLCFEVYVHSLCRSPEVCECWQEAAFQNILVVSLTLLIAHYSLSLCF